MATTERELDPSNGDRDGFVRILIVFLRLGLTSFGGPVAHLAYFREAFVQRLKWLDDRAYADLVALCQFLPGPASSQVGIGVGLMRGGYSGALAAWIGFTLPSALLMAAFAMSLASMEDGFSGDWLHGLKVVVVAVVAQAVWEMGRKLCPDRARATLAVTAAGFTLLVSGPAGQVGAILLGGLVGLMLPANADADRPATRLEAGVGLRAGIASLCLFVLLLLGLPVLAALYDSTALAMFDAFYRAGALVFGGGHVVLPLLQAEVVPAGWVSEDAFLAGYGAAQAVPGPLFTFAAYLGAASAPAPNGVLGAVLCLVAVFLPSFLLVIGVLPLWRLVRERPVAGRVMRGVNAAVVGLLLAALYAPVWTYGVQAPMDFVFVLAAFLVLVFWRLPPWLVVIAGGVVYALMG